MSDNVPDVPAKRSGGPPLIQSYRAPHPSVSWQHDNEPQVAESIQRRAARQKNADKRFNSPFGFHEPKYKKVSIFQRYPKATHRALITTCLLLFFSKPIYDATIRQPTEYELQRAEFLKRKMQETGWWDNPFWPSSWGNSSKK